jgi:F-type H+-transporting ATPase subunit b
MPQIAQLSFVFWSQLFWLAIVFGIIFFVIGRGMLPKIQATVKAREAKIAEDLAGAERARADAADTEIAYRARIDEGRAAATRVTQASKDEMQREAEVRIKAADAEIAAKTKTAEDGIRKASGAAMKEIETVAAEIAQDLVAKLAGVQVAKDRAAAAVKAALHG